MDENESSIKSERIISQAVAHIRKGEVTLGIQFFQEALKLTPRIHFNLGLAHREIQDYENSIFHFEKAIELDPNLAVAYNSLGIVYDDQKNFTKALELFQKAAQIDSTHALSRANIG